MGRWPKRLVPTHMQSNNIIFWQSSALPPSHTSLSHFPLPVGAHDFLLSMDEDARKLTLRFLTPVRFIVPIPFMDACQMPALLPHQLLCAEEVQNIPKQFFLEFVVPETFSTFTQIPTSHA